MTCPFIMLLPTLWLRRNYDGADLARPERCCDCCRLIGAVLLVATLPPGMHEVLIAGLARLRELKAAAPPGAPEPLLDAVFSLDGFDSCLGVFGHSDAQQGTEVQFAFNWLDEAVCVSDALSEFEGEIELRIRGRILPADCRTLPDADE